MSTQDKDFLARLHQVWCQHRDSPPVERWAAIVDTWIGCVREHKTEMPSRYSLAKIFGDERNTTFNGFPVLRKRQYHWFWIVNNQTPSLLKPSSNIDLVTQSIEEHGLWALAFTLNPWYHVKFRLENNRLRVQEVEYGISTRDFFESFVFSSDKTGEHFLSTMNRILGEWNERRQELTDVSSRLLRESELFHSLLYFQSK